MSVNNSISTILTDFVRLQNNSIEILKVLNNSTVSNQETVLVSQTDELGVIQTYNIPSFGYLKYSVEDLKNQILKLTGKTGEIRNPDGTFKPILRNRNTNDAPLIGELQVPLNFVTEPNWFFEDMMTPALKVQFDVSKWIPQEESKIWAKRVILKKLTGQLLEYINNQYLNKPGIDYVELIKDLERREITYYIDESIYELPLQINRHSGDFYPLLIEYRPTTVGPNQIEKRAWYKLDTLKYNDNISSQKNGETLKNGDQLRFGDSNILRVDNVDNGFVLLTLISGDETPGIGSKAVINSAAFSIKTAKIGVSPDEWNFIFFKGINDESNIIATNYSPGVCFYTNDLKSGTEGKTLLDFYKESVFDIGKFLINTSKEKIVTAIESLKPNTPNLEITNFKVLRINDHKLNVDEVNAIKQKQSDKLRLDSEIKEITNSIYKKTIELNTQKFSSDTEKRAYKNQLDSLIRDKASKSSQYATIINELNILATQKPAALDEPKYRLRGFFAIPEPVFDNKKQKQSVIQFRIYWRYLSPDGKNPVSEQIDFVEKSGNTRRGTYSNWNVLTTGLRSRFFNTTTFVYDWANEKIEDPEIVNINQIDISISKGESVQFYVKAIGEGGWPLNPIESDKSNIITFEFPNNLSTADSATTALKQSEEERVLLKLQNDIAARGLDVHLQSSFNTNDAYYAHNSEIISSGFFTNEGNVISLYEKIKELTIKVQDLENRLNKVVGNIKVYLIDDTTKAKVEIKNGDTFNLFAGYYKDFTNLLAPADRRGAIISKKWKIQLENGDATPLQLISRFPGGIADLLPDSSSVINPDSDYVNYRKYDTTPIVNTSIGNNDTNNANRVSSAFYQSGQLRGQYLYSRYTDIGLVNPLYISNIADNNALVPTGFGSVVDLSIWDLGIIPASTLPSGNGKLNTFCIHTDHPLLNTGNLISLGELQTPNINIDANGKPSVIERTSAFRHSFNFNIEGSLNNPTKQCKYNNNWINATTVPNSSYNPTINMLPDKFGFIDNDRYLVGSDTCGAYFYIAPSTIESLMVDGSDARATRSVDIGETNAIVIPIILQFRMTDYFGPSIVGTVATGGDGIVGGYNPANTVQPQNITYVRKIGLDLYQLDKTVFSFDLQASATYQKDSLVQILDASVPVKTILVKDIGIKKQFLKTIFQ